MSSSEQNQNESEVFEDSSAIEQDHIETADDQDIMSFGDSPVPESPVAETETETTTEEAPAEDDQSLELKAANNTRYSPNVNMTKIVYRVDTRPLEKRGPSLTLVPKRVQRLVDNPEAWNISDEDSRDEQTNQFISRWVHGLSPQHSSGFHDEQAFFEHTLDNPESEWTQGIQSNDGREIYARKPEIPMPTQRRVLTGAAARNRISSSIGVGITTRIPLPHTGMSVSLSPRSTQDYIDLDTLLSLDRARTGRDTVGLIYQNSHIGIVSRVWDFIRESIKGANRQNFGEIDLGDEIRITDFPILQWGMACTMFPDGYPLDLPCSSGPNICRHVEHVNLDLDKLLWINGKGLSQAQREKLGKPTHPMSKMEIDEYQTNALSPFTKTVAISDRHKLVLKVPTINEYIAAGEEWISSMTNAAIGIFGAAEENEDKVRAYVRKVSAASSLREYGHWVKSIIIDEYDEIEDFASIGESLNELSNSDTIIETALKEIQRFIEESTIAIIAIPNFSCPKCETDYVQDDQSKHPELIPLDMLKHFFTLKDLRLISHSAMQET